MEKNCRFMQMATFVVLGLMGLSCSRLEEIPQNEPAETPEKTTHFTLTVEADKGAPTKALEDKGTYLQSTWRAGDVVTVYAGNQLLGELTASTGGSSSTTLEGDLTQAPQVGEALTLKFRSDSYLTQKGTLDYIAANCDYALATVSVESVSGMQITTTPALFESQQAIVKFALQNADGDAIAVSQFLLNNGSATFTINLDTPGSIVYVALPAFSNQTVTLSAAAGTNYYDLSKADVTFECGKFYTRTAKLKKQPVSSITLDGNAVTYIYSGAPASEAI